jgi:hypothetical protein
MRLKLPTTFLLIILIVGPLFLVGNANSGNQVIENSTIFSADKQGFCPFALAITQDGKYAYLSFDLYEVIQKIDLTTHAVIAYANLSKYFPTECELLVLDATETKLFAYIPTWQCLLVIDSQTMNVIFSINNISITDLTQSHFGHTLIAPTGGGTVYLINTDTYQKTEVNDNESYFVKIRESKFNQNIWYTVSTPPPGTSVKAGLYNFKNNTWISAVTIPTSSQQGIFDLECLNNEQKFYVATFEGWYPTGYHANGFLYCIDLTKNNYKTLSIDGAAMCLERSYDDKWLYIGTGWPYPNDDKNILVMNLTSDTITNQIYLGRNIYGSSFTQMDNLKINPAHPNILYATNADGNSLITIDLDTLSPINVLQLNDARYFPRYFVNDPTENSGYLLIQQSPIAFRLDLSQEAISNVEYLPGLRIGYDFAITNTGRMFVAQGEKILEFNQTTKELISTHPLPSSIGGLWQFKLSNDQTKLYSIWKAPNDPSSAIDTFLVIDTSSFQVEKILKLGGIDYNFLPFELPGGSKLYALGGEPNGKIIVQVINKSNYTIQKTITFNQSGLLGISAGPYYPFAYDSKSQTLFVAGSMAVLAIDTQTDTIKKIINLGDTANAIGLEANKMTVCNAVGIVYNPNENCLYIAHFDRSYISIYNLTENQFLPLLIPLQGYTPTFAFSNSDCSKIFCLMARSDTVSVIDTKTKTVEKVIDLHKTLSPTTITKTFLQNNKASDLSISSNSSISSLTFSSSTKKIVFSTVGTSFNFPFLFTYNITIPNELLKGPFTIRLNNTSFDTFIQQNNGTHTSIIFSTELQNSMDISITGTETSTTPSPTPAASQNLNPTQTPSTIPTIKPTLNPTNSTSETLNSTSPYPTPTIPEISFTLIVITFLFSATGIYLTLRTMRKRSFFYNNK